MYFHSVQARLGKCVSKMLLLSKSNIFFSLIQNVLLRPQLLRVEKLKVCYFKVPFVCLTVFSQNVKRFELLGNLTEDTL